MLVANYINDKNRVVWDELRNLYKIELEYQPQEKSWRIETEGLKATIITPTKERQLSAFTHELLHLYIDSKGMTSAETILYSIFGHFSFQILTINSLLGIIHNFLCHKKMFPFFVEMGFSEQDFVSIRAKYNRLQHLLIKLQLKSRQIEGVTDFIGNTIALLCNDGSSYETYNRKKLRSIRKLNPQLFEICNQLVSNWSKQSDYDLLPLFNDFNASLEIWAEENIST